MHFFHPYHNDCIVSICKGFRMNVGATFLALHLLRVCGVPREAVVLACKIRDTLAYKRLTERARLGEQDFPSTPVDTHCALARAEVYLRGSNHEFSDEFLVHLKALVVENADTEIAIRTLVAYDRCRGVLGSGACVLRCEEFVRRLQRLVEWGLDDEFHIAYICENPIDIPYDVCLQMAEEVVGCVEGRGDALAANERLVLRHD